MAHIIDLENTLQCYRVLTHQKSYIFGDKWSVISSMTMVYAKLHKGHMMLSFHCVQKAITVKSC